MNTKRSRCKEVSWALARPIKLGNCVLCIFLSISCALAYATQDKVSQTKETLATIASKIHHIQKHLAEAHDKQSQLQQACALIEKRIHDTKLQLHNTEAQYNSKQRDISKIKAQIDTLNQQYQDQQNELNRTLVMRYKLSDKKAIASLLQHQHADSINQLLMYYRYLLQANKRALETLKTTAQQLLTQKTMLDSELQKLLLLQQQLQQQQQSLQKDQRDRASLMQSLNQDIHQTQQSLDAFRQSQIRLTHLLTTLAQQSVLQTRYPLSKMKKRLIEPVNSNQHHRINQGILFSAPEGEPVVAVFPGKVIFSDWLNAYGSLIIVDHGWGFMTLYANNAKVFKQKGDTVAQGERIANVGHSGAFRQNGLYFEIRHRGKAIPPLEWLK